MSELNKAVFLDRDGVINVERAYIRKVEDFELYPFTAEAIKRINQSGYKAIVITNQAMIARRMGTYEELEAIHNKLKNELSKISAYVDAIYFCPHHPDKTLPNTIPELNINCECRKPKPGMFFQAAKEHNISLSESYMIGDTERDLISGNKAGCKTIGVKTGHALKGATYTGDYVCENIEKAVDYILSQK